MTFEIKIQTMVMLGSGETQLPLSSFVPTRMFVTYESQKKSFGFETVSTHRIQTISFEIGEIDPRNSFSWGQVNIMTYHCEIIQLFENCLFHAT